MAAGGFIRRICHPALFNDGDPGGAAADIHHPGVIEQQQIRHRGRLIQHMTDLQPGGLQDIDRNARIGAGRKRGRRMGEAAAQLLLESRKMSAHEGDRRQRNPRRCRRAPRRPSQGISQPAGYRGRPPSTPRRRCPNRCPATAATRWRRAPGYTGQRLFCSLGESQRCSSCAMFIPYTIRNASTSTQRRRRTKVPRWSPLPRLGW